MLFKDRNQNLVYIALVIAIVLGVYAQGITYYIDEYIISMSLGILIAIITIVSLALFIIPTIIINKNYKKTGHIDKAMKVYMAINAIIGIPVSAFSIFVMIMWQN